MFLKTDDWQSSLRAKRALKSSRIKDFGGPPLLHDDDHPFHAYISKLRSGSLCAYKSRCACGTHGSYSFIRHYINFINTVIAGN